MCTMQGKPCQPWHALDNAASHLHPVLWQKMQLSFGIMSYRAPERGAQVPAGVYWAQGSEGRTEGGNK